jgi:hypothetical protein
MNLSPYRGWRRGRGSSDRLVRAALGERSDGLGREPYQVATKVIDEGQCQAGLTLDELNRLRKENMDLRMQFRKYTAELAKMEVRASSQRYFRFGVPTMASSSCSST